MINSSMLTKTVAEINLGWARMNPDLFLKSVSEFYEKFKDDDFKFRLDTSRDEYLSIIAERKE